MTGGCPVPAADAARLDAALARLEQRSVHGIRPGLDVIRALLAALGNPQAAVPAVHVAGTNGKGSVCALLAAVLQAHGLKTGRYTSPHLVHFRERCQVAGHCIPDAALAGLLEEVEAAARGLEQAGHRPATFFEVGTALAFEHFRRAPVDVAVLETGLGGRWDATNVVTPLVSVITRIDLDHQEYLGPTIAAIAGEKAGIIKPGRPVVWGAQPAAALEVLRAAARAMGAPVVAADEVVSVSRGRQDLFGQKLRIETAAASYGTVRLPLAGRFQLENVALVMATLELLDQLNVVTLDPAAVRRGLEAARWPARCQVLNAQPLVLLDGAHNPNGAAALAGVIREVAQRRPVGLVAGMLADKDVAGSLRHLAPLVARAWAVTPPSPRALAADGLAAALRAQGVATEPADLADALAAACAWAADAGGMVVIAGSLYLAGAVLGRVADGRFKVDQPDALAGLS